MNNYTDKLRGFYTCLASRSIGFVKKHPLYSAFIAGVLFIAFVVLGSLYANSLVWNYQTVNGHPVGISTKPSLTSTLVNYDGSHYVQIAQQGYKSFTDAAFLPLYPLLIRFFERVSGVSYDWAALLVSWIALCAAMVVLYKWLSFELESLNKKVSPWVIIGLIAIFPTAFYFALPYTESLFLLFNVGALYAYRKGNYFTAAIAAALASATRDEGMLLSLFFVLDFMLSKKRNYRKVIPIIGGVVGFALFMVFLKIHYGSAFEFITAEKAWGRLSGSYFVNLADSFRPIYVWFVAVVIVGLWSIYRYVGLAYFLYSLAFILLPIATGSFLSVNRFMVTLTPIFLGLGLLAGQKIPNLLKLIYITSSVFLLGWSILLFANGYWVG